MSQTLEQPRCIECNNRRFKNEAALKAHLTRSHNKEPERHWARKQGQKRIYKPATNPEQLRYQSLVNKNGKVTYSCKQCDMTFEGGTIARVHERMFDHEITFQ